MPNMRPKRNFGSSQTLEYRSFLVKNFLSVRRFRMAWSFSVVLLVKCISSVLARVNSVLFTLGHISTIYKYIPNMTIFERSRTDNIQISSKYARIEALRISPKSFKCVGIIWKTEVRTEASLPLCCPEDVVLQSVVCCKYGL